MAGRTRVGLDRDDDHMECAWGRLPGRSMKHGTMGVGSIATFCVTVFSKIILVGFSENHQKSDFVPRGKDLGLFLFDDHPFSPPSRSAYDVIYNVCRYGLAVELCEPFLPGNDVPSQRTHNAGAFVQGCIYVLVMQP